MGITATIARLSWLAALVLLFHSGSGSVRAQSSPLPDELSQGFERLKALAPSCNDGSVRQSHCFMLLDMEVRKLRQRFPRHGATIDSFIANLNLSGSNVPPKVDREQGRPPYPPAASTRSSSPWRKDSWTDELCGDKSGAARDLCRNFAILNLQQDFDSLTEVGRQWVRETCPNAHELNACVHREVRAMLRAGWPTLDGVDTAQRNEIWRTCPRSLGPSKWRECAEIAAGLVHPPEATTTTTVPKSFPQPATSNDAFSAHTKGTRSALPPWMVPNATRPSHVTRSLNPQELFNGASKSVYVVTAVTSAQQGAFSQGSAVAVSRNEAITTCHVVAHSTDILISDGSMQWRAIISSADVQSDRCYLLVFGATLAPVAGTRPYSDLRVGETVYTIGAPKGLEKTFGHGLISGLRAATGVKYVQITAPISAGSSGGGLFDEKGNLIGVTTFTVRDAQNLNFAIAASEYWR